MTVETVADVPDSLALVTGDYETRQILADVGEDPDEYPRVGMFVETAHGAFTRVYWYRGHVPYLYKPVYRLV